jgi:hypothetical protein
MVMKGKQNSCLTSDETPRCGIFWDSLAEETIRSCDRCPRGECIHLNKEPEEETDSGAYYLKSCGLIAAYLL